MKQLDDNEVRNRAFYLWEAAGRPDRKMDDFWYEAERQLYEERNDKQRNGAEAKAPQPH